MKKIITLAIFLGYLNVIANAEVKNNKDTPARRGLVTTSNCPYTCKDEKLSNKDCREWQKGTRCYIEDFTQPPGHRTRFALHDNNAKRNFKR